METFTGAKSMESRPGVAAGRRAGPVSAGLVGAGIALILVVGLIHLINSPEDLEEGSYTGVLYLANFLGALAAAVGIYRGRSWGWALGLIIAAGAFVAYVISRTAGLPGLPVETDWLEPLGVLSLIVEALFMGTFLAIFFRPAKDSSVAGAGTDTEHGGRS